MLGMVHRFLGPTIIILGLVNGGLGLDLAGKLLDKRALKIAHINRH
jgi:hypothetical protein